MHLLLEQSERASDHLFFVQGDMIFLNIARRDWQPVIGQKLTLEHGGL